MVGYRMPGLKIVRLGIRSSARGDLVDCSSADENRVRRTCIRRRRSGGMEPAAVLRSQLSVLGQFHDGAEDIFLHC